MELKSIEMHLESDLKVEIEAASDMGRYIIQRLKDARSFTFQSMTVNSGKEYRLIEKGQTEDVLVLISDALLN